MDDFTVEFGVHQSMDGIELSRITIIGKDGEEVLNVSPMATFIYPGDLISLGKWQDYRGFTLRTVNDDS